MSEKLRMGPTCAENVSSGKARKFRKIIEAQGGHAIQKSSEIQIGDKTFDVLPLDGSIARVENSIVGSHGPPVQGIILFTRRRTSRQLGDALVTVYAEKDWKLSRQSG
jgi:thymidine phosphorylase